MSASDQRWLCVCPFACRSHFIKHWLIHAFKVLPYVWWSIWLRKKYFKLYCVLHNSSNENWFPLSTNTVLATKFPTDFNSTLLCFPTNCSKCCYIDTLFFNMCHTLKTRLYTQMPMHMSSVDLYKGQVSLASRSNWLCFTRNETKAHWQSKFLLSLSLQFVLYLSGAFFW